MTLDAKQAELVAQLAQDYYLSNLSLAELSDKYQLSRYLINKYLADARREGIVSIHIASPNPRNLGLEHVFKQRFQIPHIYILHDHTSPRETSDHILQFAAKQIAPLITQSQVVGLTWGESLFNLIQKFDPQALPDVTFTQFLGENMQYKSAAGSMRMVELVAAKFSSRYLTMTGPLYIENDLIRTQFSDEPALQPAFTAARQMDLLFTAFGTFESLKSVPGWAEHTATLFADVDPNDVAGMLYGRPYNRQGQFITVQDKTFGLTLPEIMATPRRFGVVTSKAKAAAALGALRGHLLTDLVMSESVAHHILNEI